VLFTEANFNRIKDNQVYKENFTNYLTLQAFNNYIEEVLESKNINILINNIIRIINIINEREEDNSKLEIKELILKANLSENQKVFKDTVDLSDSNSDDKFIIINRVINESLRRNLDEKLDLLIELEKLSEFFYPNFSDKLSMKKFEKKIKEKSTYKDNQDENLNIKELYKKLTEDNKKDLLNYLLKDKGLIQIVKAKLEGMKNDFYPSKLQSN